MQHSQPSQPNELEVIQQLLTLTTGILSANGNTALATAVICEQQAIVEQAAKGVIDEHQTTVKLLLSQTNVDLSATNQDGNSLLHLAAVSTDTSTMITTE